MKKKLAVLAVAGLILTVAALPVLATQTFRYLHHESQGVGDPSWTKCMPDDAWNGHKRHQGDWQGDICDPNLQPTTPPSTPTTVPPTTIPPTQIPPTEIVPTERPTEPAPTEIVPTEIVPTQQSTEVVMVEPTPQPRACYLDVQLYAVTVDLPANAAYLAVAYNPKPPDLITQEDEGEVANMYIVNNGGVKAIQPNGHQAAFLALDVRGYSGVDGNAYVRGCSGSIFINMYDAAGNFLGHPMLRWDGAIAKGFHAINSGYGDELSFLDLGVMPK